jgi:tripartite-type tricarboxylate transporter receptor subunit TctC
VFALRGRLAGISLRKVRGMELPRRRLLCASGAITLATLVPITLALTYPSRPVHLIEGFGAGGTPGILARLLGQWLAERWGQPFVVENRSGATGKIATEAVVRASPDGHTLLLVVPANVIDAVFRDTLSYDFRRDIAPVAGIYRVPYVMNVHPSIPANTIPEFVAYAKSRPTWRRPEPELEHRSPGELFKMTTGVDMVHGPFRGTQVYPDLLGGQCGYFLALCSLTVAVSVQGYEASACGSAWEPPGPPRSKSSKSSTKRSTQHWSIPQSKRNSRNRVASSFRDRQPTSAS